VGDRKAYEMMSVYLGLIESWRATGERRHLDAAHRAWRSIRDENHYLTGGVEAHEKFEPPGQIEPRGACTETCVQVTWFQLTLRLLEITGEASYADEIHRHVYNHLLAAQRPAAAPADTPAIEIQETRDGSWRRVAALDGYRNGTIQTRSEAGAPDRNRVKGTATIRCTRRANRRERTRAC
jgi:hypothetical protein